MALGRKCNQNAPGQMGLHYNRMGSENEKEESGTWSDELKRVAGAKLTRIARDRVLWRTVLNNTCNQ